jgi:hypothetical protein
MQSSKHEAYSLPDHLAPELTAVLNYWRGLRRAENSMPFADDIDLSAIASVPHGGMLVEVFEDPLRFRFGYAGQDVCSRFGEPLTGKFSDEISSRSPLEELTAQASFTVTSRAPTYYSHQSGYSRILLPAWGEGHIALLLGSVV